MKILIILGTARLKSNSEKVALWLYEQVRNSFQFECNLISPHTLQLNFQNEGFDYPDTKYRNMIQNADAYIIVTPEYNHSFPGSLKFILDIGKKSDYHHKPVAFVGVTTGDFGATRAIQSLIPVVRTLGMIPVSIDINVVNADKIFAENGQPIDKIVWDRRLKKVIEELSLFATKLRC